MSDYVGLDLGSYLVKLAKVSTRGKKVTVNGLGEVYNPVGQMLPADDHDFQKLTGALKEFASNNKVRGQEIRLSLPESMAYTSVISLPYLTDAELASSIHWEAEQHIPVPLEEVNLEYDILYKPKKGDAGEKMMVLLVAAKKGVVERLVKLMHAAGMEVVALETSMLSVRRSLEAMLQEMSGGVAICDIGALSTEIMIVEDGTTMLTYAVNTGGLALTRSVEKSLGLSASQAEQYKRTYGLVEDQLEGKVRQALAPVLNMMVTEIRKAIQFYQTSQTRKPVRQMILSGGGAYMPQLASYLAQLFSFEVTMAQPFAGVELGGVKEPQFPAVYSTALGLAMKEEG